MNCNTHFSSVSPLRITAVCVCIGAAWVFAPHITHAAVAFGEIGQNVAENAKGVAKGITMGGYAAGAGMGLWDCFDMYDASCHPAMTNYIYNNL